MSKKLTLVLALLGVAALLAVPAYAEVQNIKVSGDINAMGIYRNNYDLEDGRNVSVHPGLSIPGTGEYINDDANSYLMTVTRLRVDADLTDNVAVTVRLANLREWDVGTGDADSDIFIDLASITLKEMLYSPLTLMIGRQELNYGNGMIVGYGLYHDPDGAANIIYRDLSPMHGYDAIRAILDYDPWTFDMVTAKMAENDDAANGAVDAAANRGRNSDIDLYGINVGYRFAEYDAEMEGYCFVKSDEAWNYRIDSDIGSNGNRRYTRLYEVNDVYTLGLRGSAVPMENLTLGLEIAGQLGEIRDETFQAADLGGDTGSSMARDREAMLLDVRGEYDLPDIRFAPEVGLQYVYLSGEDAGDAGNGDYEAWDSMYRGHVLATIRDCQETINAAYDTNDNLDTAGNTNQHTIKATCGLNLGELVDGLSLDLAYMHFWFDEKPLADADDDIGDEVDLKVVYDYTEDVQFALNGAMFIPGDYYDRIAQGNAMGGRRGNVATNRVANDTAVSVIGSCKVSF